MHRENYAMLVSKGKENSESGQVSWAYMNTYGGCIEQLSKVLEATV
jgi:hypothetical protein